MVKRNMRWLGLGIVLAIIGAFGLYWTIWGSSGEEQRTDSQRVLTPEEKPVIPSPGTGIPEPEPQEGADRP